MQSLPGAQKKGNTANVLKELGAEIAFSMEACNDLGNSRSKRPHTFPLAQPKWEQVTHGEKGTDRNTERKPSQGKNMQAQAVYGNRLFSPSLHPGQASSVAPHLPQWLCALVSPPPAVLHTHSCLPCSMRHKRC